MEQARRRAKIDIGATDTSNGDEVDVIIMRRHQAKEYFDYSLHFEEAYREIKDIKLRWMFLSG